MKRLVFIFLTIGILVLSFLPVGCLGTSDVRFQTENSTGQTANIDTPPTSDNFTLPAPTYPQDKTDQPEVNSELVLPVASSGYTGRNLEGSFIGPISQKQVKFRLYLPPGYDNTTENYPVIYHLHGLGGSYRSSPQVDKYYSEMMKEQKMPAAIIVFPDGATDSFWADSYDGSKLVETNVIRELIPYIDAHYRTIKDRRYRIIQGFSMGGFGAMEYASKFPELFKCGISLDGALLEWGNIKNSQSKISSGIFNNDPAYFQAFSPYDNVSKNSVNVDGKVDLLLFEAQLSSKAFCSLLKSLNVPFTLQKAPCGHDLGCIYNTCGEEIVSFLNKSLGFKK